MPTEHEILRALIAPRLPRAERMWLYPWYVVWLLPLAVLRVASLRRCNFA